MNKLFAIALLIYISLHSTAQTNATNFNCNDCSGVNHDLFSELNAGKVVVIVWVMPCSSCLPGALAAQSACQSYATSNPGQVLFYCVDDYANSSCSTISSWCTTNGITTATKFSNASIDMLDYGSTGMPKVVVLGDSNHTVYYNQNNTSITTSGIQTAIGNALSSVAANIKENQPGNLFAANVYPNPANNSCTLNFFVAKNTEVEVDLQNHLGQCVKKIYKGNIQKGENTTAIDLAALPNGNYFISLYEGSKTKKIKLVVIH